MPTTPAVVLTCRAGALCVGDQVRTTAHRWETVTDLDQGEAFTRSVRVTTNATGPDHPWIWTNNHRVTVRRCPAPAHQLGVAA